jgi:hypothetical protein
MDILSLLVPGVEKFFKGQTKSTPVTVSFEIPSNHPQAAKIRALAKHLACESELASGIRVKKLAIPGAAEEFMDALKPVVGSDTIDDVKERLRPTPLLPKLPPQDALVQLVRNFEKKSK